MKANRLLRSHRRAHSLVVAAAASEGRAAEKAERRAEAAQIDDALRELGRRRREGALTEREFAAERQRLMTPVTLCPVIP